MLRLILALCFVGLVASDPIPKPLIEERWLPDTYIVGGSSATSGQFRYQVSLRRVNGNSHFCGASILNTRYILTAAHCVYDQNPANIYAVVGSISLNSGGTRYNFDRITSQNYDPNSITRDVSVCHTTAAISMGSTVAAIGLATANYNSGTATVSGWGRTSHDGPIPNNLQYLSRTLITLTSCRQQIRANDDNVCTQGTSGRGMCFGDSGGPLVVGGTEQIGICSFIVSRCAYGYPDAYTNVYTYRTWITNQIS